MPNDNPTNSVMPNPPENNPGTSDLPITPTPQPAVPEIQGGPLFTNNYPTATPSIPRVNDSTIDMPQVTSPEVPQKYGGKKVIATIFGVLLLLTSVTAGVYLVQQNANPNRRASSGSECDHSANCELLDNPGNSGRYSATLPIEYVYITAQEAARFDSQTTDNGCYRVSISGKELEWQRYGSGASCKTISNIQVWLDTDVESTDTPTVTISPQPTITGTETTTITITPLPTSPPQGSDISAQCGQVTAYNTAWKLLSNTDLSSLNNGDTVRFAVSATSDSGTIDRVKFTINGTVKEATTKRTGTDDFYIDYQIPQGVENFTVTAEAHHSELGWF